jgi:2-polyprenyl-3-methyl-5-hydroxy-6-metoxy-1,4-benzoquinol methylase
VTAQAERYRFKDFPHSSHRVLIDLVGREPARVLEIGTAWGLIGARLTELGHSVVGVEIDSRAAALARPHYQSFYEADVMTLARVPEAPFDVVVAGDVLEHMPRPSAALRLLAELLEPDGRLLISVPNVAFVTVRLSLLVGRFEYAHRGILDRDHLRFLTRRSLQRSVRDAGLEPRRLVPLPPPLPLVWPAAARWPWRALYELARAGALAWPGLLAFQMVCECTRAERGARQC